MILKNISKQFLCTTNLKDLNWNDELKNLSWEDQYSLLQQTVNHPLVLRYPVKISYQVAFLKYILDFLENELIEVHDDLYSKYCSLLGNKAQNEFSYKHYVILLEDKLSTISLKESSKLISDGTTGLHTWEASFVLSEWCIQNSNILNGKNILELGSGIGLTGLAVAKCCQPRQIWLTDCHTSVLKVLIDNVKQNYLESENGNCCNNGNETTERNLLSFKVSDETEIGVLNLPWEDVNNNVFVGDVTVPDIILAADLVYDSSIFLPLSDAFEYFLKANTNCQIYLVCTIRNESTIEEFINLLESRSFLITELPQPEPLHLNWSHSLRTKLFKIYN